MRIPTGYTLAPEEHLGSCIGCAFNVGFSNIGCNHPDYKKGTDSVGCAKSRKIFKRDNKNLRKKISEIINKFGIDNNNNVPDHVLADHMIKSMDVFCEASKDLKRHMCESQCPSK